jgi:hypothetical protein
VAARAKAIRANAVRRDSEVPVEVRATKFSAAWAIGLV